MGKASRHRRRDKFAARSRTAREQGTPGGQARASQHHGDSRPEVAARLRALIEGPSERSSALLAEVARFPTQMVDDLLETTATSLLARLWDGGWQPAEVLRQARRGSVAEGGLARYVVAADYGARRADTMDFRWRSQVDSLGLPGGVRATSWLRRWTADDDIPDAEAHHVAIALLRHLVRLPVLEVLIPPPGSTPVRAAARVDRADLGTDPVLARIRALLAKAESTPYEAEAVAFTAKATELMTRHAIDAALLAGSGAEEPVMVRIAVDAPYVAAKSLLLQTVAHHTRCRTVFRPAVEMSTVVGFPTDVAGTEVMFTSLLVQAQRALAEAARSAPPGTRVRSQSYRSSFLAGFTQRIGERLAETNRAVETEVEAADRRALPALRSRRLAVDEAVEAQFGELVKSRARPVSDASGWSGGRQAAELANLHAGAVGI